MTEFQNQIIAHNKSQNEILYESENVLPNIENKYQSPEKRFFEMNSSPLIKYANVKNNQSLNNIFELKHQVPVPKRSYSKEDFYDL